MDHDRSPSSPHEGRVLRFRRKTTNTRAPRALPPHVADLSKYQRADDTDDDYRHRMLVNAVVFVLVAALIAAGLWLADSIAQMRKDQDCVLAGHRDCTPVEYSPKRW